MKLTDILSFCTQAGSLYCRASSWSVTDTMIRLHPSFLSLLDRHPKKYSICLEMFYAIFINCLSHSNNSMLCDQETHSSEKRILLNCLLGSYHISGLIN